MIKRETQLFLQKVERLLWVAFVFEQCLSILNLANLIVVLMPLHPRSQHFVRFVKLLRVLKMQTVEIVVLLSSGNQLSQRNRPVLSQRKFLDKPNLLSVSRHLISESKRHCTTRSETNCEAVHLIFLFVGDQGSDCGKGISSQNQSAKMRWTAVFSPPMGAPIDCNGPRNRLVLDDTWPLAVPAKQDLE